MNIVKWEKQALKQLAKIDARYKQAIKTKVDELEKYPDVMLDLKKLKGHESKYRLRVGNYRVIFEIINEVPRIIAIQAVVRRSERTYN